MTPNSLSELITITISIETRRKLEAYSENGKVDFDEIIRKLLYCPLLSYKKLDGLN